MSSPGPLVVVAGPGAGDGRARLAVASGAALRAIGVTPFPLDTAPLDDTSTGAELLTWLREQAAARAVLWLGQVPAWAAALTTNDDLVLAWDPARAVLRLSSATGHDGLDVAMPALDPAEVSGAGPPGPVGTLVVDGAGRGWPVGRAVAGPARLVSDHHDPDAPATTVRRPSATTLVAWMAAADEVVVLGDPSDVDVAGWQADAGHVARQVELDPRRPGRGGPDDPAGPSLAAALAGRLRLEPPLDPAADDAASAARVRDRAPRVSVVVPTFNSAPFVRATIESILDQTFTDLELVVVDDGSTDGTDRIVASYAGDLRLHLHRQTNLGHLGRWEASNNRTWSTARGELVARLDGDDVAAPDRLARQVAAFDADPRVGLVHTAGTRIDADGRPAGPTFALPFVYDTRSQLRTIVAANVVAHPTVMVRRSLLVGVEAYAGGWASDYDLWLRLARATRFRFLPEALVAYRVHGGGVSSTAAGAERSVAEGVAARGRARSGLSIAELVPELPAGAGVEATVAAHVELAHHLLVVGGPPNAPLALAELDRALALQRHPLVGVAAVAAALVSGDDDELRRRVAWSEEHAPGFLAQARAELGAVPQVHGRLLWAPLGAEPPEWTEGHVDALGRPVGRISLRWRGEDPVALRAVVAAYLRRFGAHEPVRLVLDLGPDTERAMATVAAALDGLEGVEDGAALELADATTPGRGMVALDDDGDGPLAVLDRVRRRLVFSDPRPLR